MKKIIDWVKALFATEVKVDEVARILPKPVDVGVKAAEAKVEKAVKKSTFQESKKQ